MASAMNLQAGMPTFSPRRDRLCSARNVKNFVFQCELSGSNRRFSRPFQTYKRSKIITCHGYGNSDSEVATALFSPNGSANSSSIDAPGFTRVNCNSQRKTKIICTIGPSTSSREMIWKLAETGMNVARLNMSHGDHASHQKTIDLVKEYNAQFEEKVVAIMLDTKVSPLKPDIIGVLLLFQFEAGIYVGCCY